jgi:hypothetical protein
MVPVRRGLLLGGWVVSLLASSLLTIAAAQNSAPDPADVARALKEKREQLAPVARFTPKDRFHPNNILQGMQILVDEPGEPVGDYPFQKYDENPRTVWMPAGAFVHIIDHKENCTYHKVGPYQYQSCGQWSKIKQISPLNGASASARQLIVGWVTDDQLTATK